MVGRVERRGTPSHRGGFDGYKEDFRTLCDEIEDRDRAQRFLRSRVWRAEVSGSRYLKRLVEILRNWWREFLDYFDGGVTQGFVEGIDRVIRGIVDRAYGFHKFETSACISRWNAVVPDAYPSNLSRAMKH